jgi:hypothetical protein
VDVAVPAGVFVCVAVALPPPPQQFVAH